MKRRMLWVVEMRAEGEEEFSATVGCELTLREARSELRFWRSVKPANKYRLSMYAAVTGKVRR